MESIINTIGKLGVIPVIAIEKADNAKPLAESLLVGGLPCAEVTFRTNAAPDSIKLISEAFPEILLGAGTVLSIDQCKQAVESGARFIVTPGFDEAVVTWSISNNIPIFPGIATPTEIIMALRLGLDTLKFFPSEELGGVKMLKALSGPFNQVRFIPTGGINLENLSDYLKLPFVLACGGSWMVKKSLISNGEFDTIAKLVQEAIRLVEVIRGG